MNLRPHHALCIQKFTGHGYDEAFTRHMTGLVAALRAHPDTVITVTRGCDELCSVCPNNEAGRCSTLEKVADMDAKVLKLCGFACGEQIPWAGFSSAAREQIFETEEFTRVCGDCQWFDLCKSTELDHEKND